MDNDEKYDRFFTSCAFIGIAAIAILVAMIVFGIATTFVDLGWKNIVIFVFAFFIIAAIIFGKK